VGLACVAVVLAGSAAGRAARADGVPAERPQNPQRVLLVVDQADDPFARRLQAELTTLGLDVRTVAAWRAGEAVDTLERAARAGGAIAAIRTVPSRKGVEIWMADQVTGRPLLRQLVVDESPGGPNQSLVALQTVEILRTSLFSRPEPPAPPPDVLTPPPAGPPSATAEVGVTAGVGSFTSQGGTGTALQVWLSLHRTLGLTHRLEVDLDLSGPALSPTLSGPEGSASVRTFLAGAALLVRHEIPAARLDLDAGLGGGAVVVAFEGHAAPPLAASSDVVASAVGYLRADVALEATRWLRLGVRGVAGLSAQRVKIQFAGNQAADWGRSFGAALAIAELCWH
jgi:hypothetical protein